MAQTKSPPKPANPQPARPRIRLGALAILEELKTIEPILARHRQEASQRLSIALAPKIKPKLKNYGFEKASEDQQNLITQEIATETSQETVIEVAKAQNVDDLNFILADSLTQSIVAHPQNQKPKDEEKVFEELFVQTQEVTIQNQSDLEKAAVLGNLAQISNIPRPDQQIATLIKEQVEETIQSQAPLTPPQQRSEITAQLTTYIPVYFENLVKNLPPISKDQAPTLATYQEVKEQTHRQTSAQVIQKLTATTQGKVLNQQLGLNNLLDNIAQLIGTKPITTQTPTPPSAKPSGQPPQATTTIASLILVNPTYQKEALASFLAYNRPRLDQSLKDAASQVESLRKKRSLSYRERKIYLQAQKRLRLLEDAKNLQVKKPKRVEAFLRFYSNLPRATNLESASAAVWTLTNANFDQYPAIYSPRSLSLTRFTKNLKFGSLGLGNLGQIMRFGFTKPSLSMGKAVASRFFIVGTAASLGGGIIKRIAKIGGLALGGLALYFLALGKAALMGFLIGAGIGGTAGALAGAYLGAQIGATIGFAVGGPFGAVVGGVIGGAIGLTAGFFTGATIGGIAGGLTAFGLASGSTTLTGTGIGMATGATIGFAVGGPFGAIIGAFLGAGAGYLVAKYVIPFANNAIDSIGAAATGTGAATGGILASIGSFFTGLAANIWGGIASAGGFLLSGISSAANFVVSGLGALSLPASAASVPVVTAVGSVAVGGTIVGVITAASFFSIEADQPTLITPPGENRYFSLAKTASPQVIENNNDLPQTITFTITLTVKDTKLTNLQITDELIVQGKNSTFTVTSNSSGQPISPPCNPPTELLPITTWTCQFTIVADTKPPERNFSDSVVSNTVSVTTTPEGQESISGTAAATTVIGNPPTICVIFDIQGAWSAKERQNIRDVCRILDLSPKVVSLLTNAGTINLVRVASGSLGSGVCGQVNGANTISISCDFSDINFAKYVLIHELGHVLGNYNGPVYQSFRDSLAYQTEGLMPTYPFGIDSPDESFAEMIGDYPSSKTYNFPLRSWSGYPGGPWKNPGPGWTTFKNDRPAHYNFTKNQIYGGVEY